MVLGCIFCGGILEWMLIAAIIAFCKKIKGKKCSDPECGCQLEDEETIEE